MGISRRLLRKGNKMPQKDVVRNETPEQEAKRKLRNKRKAYRRKLRALGYKVGLC